MADIIKCPTCGSKNAADLEFCQFCQTRLQPLTGPLKGLDRAIMPGQNPTVKDTGQLEPILPEWLREARSSAKKNSEDDVLQAAQKSIGSPTVSSGGDLLAGLRSHAQDNEEEDTPDWLTSITGETPKSKKAQTESPEVRWVELGAKNDFAQEDRSAEKPSWMTGPASSTSQPNNKDELTDWFQDAAKGSNAQETNQPFNADTPNWLHSMAVENDALSDIKPLQDNSSVAASDTPDWLRSMTVEDAKQNDDPFINNMALPTYGDFDAGKAPSAEQVPDWLKGHESETPVAASSVDLDWMNDLQTGEGEQPMQGETAPWLKADVPADEAQTPAWLTDMPTSTLPESEENKTLADPEQTDDTFGDVPNWLKAAAPQSSIFEELPAEQKVEALKMPSSDSPDWLNTFNSNEASESQKSPAFINDAQTSVNSDALFTDMPDWLSTMDNSSSSTTPKAVNNAENLAPSDLPTWVQAMRPMDSGISQPSQSSYSTDRTLESRGALAGLQGVLPARPGFAPTGKPKAYSIKLQASEEQQAQADLLERILAAETAPVPMTSFSLLSSSRGLRWLIAIVLFSNLSIVLLLRTQIFPMPNSFPIPPAVEGSLRVAQSIPNGAPVLVAFEFESARVGEMEAAAAPLFDQMLLLRRPRLVFISTRETGAILTERFISEALAGYNYQSGVDYLNLGFLPGGPMGIYAFAQAPQAIAEFAFARNSDANNLFDISLPPAWILEPWKSTTSLSQFAAFIIVTDNADSARVWIEQTTSTRGTTPVVVISSAQAAPMIQPYYASQQIRGLVSGLSGAALLEQNNAGRPGTARAYWDAYNMGIVFAVLLILVGGLWNLVLGLRDRAALRDAN